MKFNGDDNHILMPKLKHMIKPLKKCNNSKKYASF